jgi:hypothetical protein
MMKNRNYLFVLLSLTLTGVPALAVDYVACREMLRTKNEFIMLVNKEDEEIERVIANWDNALTKALHSFPFSNGEPLEFEKKRREKYYKKALKVEADMKRANCPY